MNLLVTLAELKEGLSGPFSWSSRKLNSTVFRAHPSSCIVLVKQVCKMQQIEKERIELYG